MPLFENRQKVLQYITPPYSPPLHQLLQLILYVNPSITGLAQCVCVVCVFLNKEKKTAWYREMNRITEFFTILKQNNRRFSNVSNASILCKGTVSQDFLSLFWLKSLFLGFLLKGQFDKICIYQFVSLKSELAHLSFWSTSFYEYFREIFCIHFDMLTPPWHWHCLSTFWVQIKTSCFELDF